MNRVEPRRMSDERTMLTEMLDYYRATLIVKIEGLTDAAARDATVPPSDLNLLGLVRHMADVERSWFRERFAGQTLPPLFEGQADPGADPDLDLHPGPADTVADSVPMLLAEIALARQITAANSLDTVAKVYGQRGPFNLRWVLVHLIEEYARHCGHADLLRERIDGATGD